MKRFNRIQMDKEVAKQIRYQTRKEARQCVRNRSKDHEIKQPSRTPSAR